MKIVLATPLYPPDIAPPAPYVKELAKRLSHTDTVCVLAYTRLPEQVPNVTIVAVNKRHLLPVRIILYTFALFSAVRKADMLYAQNGSSVELPVALVQFVTRKPMILRMSDKLAHEQARASYVRGLIERLASRRASRVIVDELPEKPEILPLEPKPVEALAAYEQAWKEHLESLKNIFSHVV